MEMYLAYQLLCCWLQLYAEYQAQTIWEWVDSASTFEIHSGLHHRLDFYDLKIRLFSSQIEFRGIDLGIPILR